MAKSLIQKLKSSRMGRNLIGLAVGIGMYAGMNGLENKIYGQAIEEPFLEWERDLGRGTGFSLQKTFDGGYVIVGRKLIKTDSNGNLQWEQPHGGMHVQQTFDGGYIIVETTQSFGPGDNDVYLVKTDPEGNLQWQNNFNGKDEEDMDFGHSIQQTPDGGYILGGDTMSGIDGDYDIATRLNVFDWMLKTGRTYENYYDGLHKTLFGYSA
ncbi:MAG: hypothetical protein AABY22_29690, partial [Nanoarchaeota archaeon]